MKFEGLLGRKGVKNHSCNPSVNPQVCTSLTFPIFAMLFTIFFDLLKFDCSFRFLNVDKFCFTAPLKLSTTCFREGLLEIKGVGVGGGGNF